MIDRANRDAAAKLLRQFADGEINSDDLEANWPHSNDKALAAVASMVWGFYGDGHPRRMSGRDAATPKEQDTLARYTLFLDGELPYEWPQTNFYRIAGLGVLNIMSLGLLLPLHWSIKRRNARFQSALESSGDFEVWPFIRRKDHHAAAYNI